MSALFRFRSVFFGAAFFMAMMCVAAHIAEAQDDGARLAHLHTHAVAGVPLRLSSLAVRTEIKGGFAESTLEMELFNPNEREHEGALHFSLPGHTINGLALDIEGTLRQGTPVDKVQGRKAFNEIVRRRVDPALLEMIGDNRYTLRVYPLPANGRRRVAFRVTQQLEAENGLFQYRLPLAFDGEIESFSIETEILSPKGPVKAGYADLNIAQEQAGTLYRGRVERQNIRPEGRLNITLPAPDSLADSMAAARWQDALYFSAAASISLPDKARVLPDLVTVIWDASASGLQRDHVAELSLLDVYFKKMGSGRARLIVLRDKAEKTRTFEIKNGDWRQLEATISSLVYDGASKLDDWAPSNDCREYLLFSDGLTNYHGVAGQNMPEMAPEQHLFAINSAAAADYAVLRAMAGRGRLIDLSRETAQQATDKLFKGWAAVSVINPAGAEIALGPDSANLYAADGQNGLIRLAGRAKRGGKAQDIELLLTFFDGTSQNLAVSLPTWDDASEFTGDEAPLPARLWGSYTMAELEADCRSDKESIDSLGYTLGIVSVDQETSLIVLETAQDYVRYGVTPPPSLRAQTLALGWHREKQKLDEKELLNAWQERVQWWETSFDRPSKPYSGEKITLNVVNGDLHDIIYKIGAISGKNIIFSDTKGNSITLGLIDVPWDQALDAVVTTDGLIVKETAGVMVLKPTWPRAFFEQQTKIYTGKKITLDFVKEDVQNIIRMIGGFSEKKLIVSDAVKGTVTLRLTDVPWEQALDAVVAANGLAIEESAGVITVYDRLTFAALELKRQMQASEWSGSTRPSPGSNQLLTKVLDKKSTLMLDALVDAHPDDARTISAPRIMAANDQEVLIKTGRQIPYYSGASAGATTNADGPRHPAVGGEPDLDAYLSVHGTGTVGLPVTPWDLNAPYIARMREATDDDLYAIYLEARSEYMNNSAFFCDVAKRFFERGLPELGRRVLSNVLEMRLDDWQSLRTLAYEFIEAGELADALSILETACELAPDEPQSLRDIAMVKAALGQPQEAVDLLYQIARRRGARRFGETNAIALTDMNALIAAHRGQIDTGAIDPRLIKNLASDVRVVLSWDMDNSNMLWKVTAPDGKSKGSYGYYNSMPGGRFTKGYDLGEFMLKKAMPGIYRVEGQCFGDSPQCNDGSLMAYVTVFQKFGSPEQKEEHMTLHLKEVGANVLAAEFTVTE